MCQKTKQLLSFILRDGPRDVTSLLKLSYLIDLAAVRNLGNKISEFKYIRWNFGPFDRTIYKNLDELHADLIISTESQYNGSGSETVLYSLVNPESINCDLLSDNEKNLIEEMLSKLRGYGAKMLTDIAYQTKPMTSIGATLGGTEHLSEVLNLNAE